VPPFWRLDFGPDRHNLPLWFPSAFVRRLLRSDAGVAAQGCWRWWRGYPVCAPRSVCVSFVVSGIWRCVRSCPLSGASSSVLAISGFPSSFSGSSPASPPVPTRGLLPLIRGAFWTAAWMRSAWAVRRALLGCTGHVFCMGWLAPLQPAGVVALSRCCWGRGVCSVLSSFPFDLTSLGDHPAGGPAP
jgi:hypothetical protein